jgi:1,4-dihydroxy-2-naphthoate octaprenyltransferase
LQTGSINASVILAGLGPGLLSTAILVVNNFRDVHTDRVVGKRTLAVRFGYRFTVAEYVSSIAIACLIPAVLCIFVQSHYMCLISLFTVVPAWRCIRVFLSGPDAAVLNELLADTGKLLAIFCVLFSVGWIL